MALKKIVEASALEERTHFETARIADKLRSAIESGELSSGMKLQSENKLSAAFCTTVHTIRKVLKQLREEGLIYSLPKRGVFVSERPSAVLSGTEIGNSGRLYFVTLSSLRRQQEIFASVFSKFQETPPFYEICCKNPGENFNVSSLESMGQADVVENSPLHYPRNRHLFMDIRKYFSGTLKTSGKDSCSVPFCYSTVYVCYHPDLLEKLGCGLPCWKTFDEQEAYLEQVTLRLQERNMVLPGTHFSSMELLDHFGAEMMADFHDRAISAEDFMEKYRAPVRKCTAYWNKFRISVPGQAVKHIENFIVGKTPLLFTNSSNILDLQEKYPELNFGFYPILTIANRLPRISVSLSIVKTTPFLAESVRLIGSLQSEGVQRQLAAAGYIPAEEEYYSSLPEVSAAFQGAEERFFTTPEEFYTGINILNVELWNIVLFNKKVEDALKDALSFARAYLEYQLDMKAMRHHREQGSFFVSGPEKQDNL